MNSEIPAGSAQAGPVALAASGLQWADDAAAHAQIEEAMARFELDPGRPADVTAATAYVWSRHNLPAERPEVSFDDAKLDAASEAIMRFALLGPEIFGARLQGPSPERAMWDSLIRTVVDGALADHAFLSGARPPGVALELQTGLAQRAGLDEAALRKFIEAKNTIVWDNPVE